MISGKNGHWEVVEITIRARDGTGGILEVVEGWQEYENTTSNKKARQIEE